MQIAGVVNTAGSSSETFTIRTTQQAITGVSTYVKTLFAAVLAVTLLAVVAINDGHDQNASAAAPGDTDCSGGVNALDALHVLRSSVQLPPPAECLADGDTNCDGDIDSIDALRIMRHASGLPVTYPQGCPPMGPPSPTPPPFPPQGGEPTCKIFPPDNPWNTDVSAFALHPNSDTYIDNIGRSQELHPDFGTVWNGAPIGIPYVIVGGAQPLVPVTFDYDDESDPGPYPIPPTAPIEGGPNSSGDRHVLVIDNDNCILYETFYSWPQNGGASWEAGSGAVWDLDSNALRPEYWTSADAAGLPIFPGLVRYEEVVEQGVIDHALRFTVAQTQRAFIHPATHFASSSTDPARPPMGLRLRMKASYNCNWASTETRVVCAALKRYGMIVADNGSDWYISGAPDPRWDDDALGDIKDIPGDAFEVVNTGPLIY
jgi:hypothetical protein